MQTQKNSSWVCDICSWLWSKEEEKCQCCSKSMRQAVTQFIAFMLRSAYLKHQLAPPFWFHTDLWEWVWFWHSFSVVYLIWAAANIMFRTCSNVGLIESIFLICKQWSSPQNWDRQDTFLSMQIKLEAGGWNTELSRDRIFNKFQTINLQRYSCHKFEMRLKHKQLHTGQNILNEDSTEQNSFFCSTLICMRLEHPTIWLCQKLWVREMVLKSCQSHSYEACMLPQSQEAQWWPGSTLFLYLQVHFPLVLLSTPRKLVFALLHVSKLECSFLLNQLLQLRVL